jgi:hypothetical protein
MNKLYTAIAILLSLIFFASPVFAQEATQAVESTPTVEAATEVVAPVSEPATDVHTWVDDTVEFFANNLPIIFMGITLIGLAFKVKEPQSSEQYESERREIERQRVEVKKTETKVDDALIEFRYLLNEFRGIAQTPAPTQPTTTVTTGNGTDTTITVSQPPPVIYPSAPNVGNTGTSTTDVSTPPFVPMPIFETTDFMDTFGKRGNNSYTWQQTGHPNAVIEIPDGYDYRRHNKDAAGVEYPYRAVETNDKYGTRLNVASNASVHQFIRTQSVQLGIGRHEIALSYVADVKDTEGGQPMHNWLWTEAYIDGQPVVAGLENSNHRALQNGAHVATWVLDNLTPRTVSLSFNVVVHWASAKGNSTIDLKAFGMKQAG